MKIFSLSERLKEFLSYCSGMTFSTISEIVVKEGIGRGWNVDSSDHIDTNK